MKMKSAMTVIMLGLAVQAAVGQERRSDRGDRGPATREAGDAWSGREGGAEFRGERRGFGGRFAPSDREQEEMIAFMKQFAPHRWAAMESLPDQAASRRGAMAFAAARWRHLQFLQEEDPQLYNIKVRQLIAEDDLYGLLASTRTPAERVGLRKQIREHAAEVVKQSLAERERRITRLRQELKSEEERLTEDRKNVDALIDRRTDSYITEGPVPHRAGPGRRGPRPDAPASQPVDD